LEFPMLLDPHAKIAASQFLLARMHERFRQVEKTCFVHMYTSSVLNVAVD
jgi:hypothetical protein